MDDKHMIDLFSRVDMREKQLHKYQLEFDLIACKLATKRDDLTSDETEWWKYYLVANCMIHPLVDVDFFGEGIDDDDVSYIGEISVMTWTWKYGARTHILTDINGWEDGEERGYIIMDGQIVFENYCMGLVSTHWTDKQLRKRIHTLEHIRHYEPDCPDDIDDCVAELMKTKYLPIAADIAWYVARIMLSVFPSYLHCEAITRRRDEFMEL